MFQIKIFRAVSTNKLEKLVNEFLSSNNIDEVINVQYQSSENSNIYIAVLTYKISQ